MLMSEKKEPGRPKKRPECKPINLRLSLDVIVKSIKISTKTDENRTELIERLIKEEYERLIK